MPTSQFVFFIFLYREIKELQITRLNMIGLDNIHENRDIQN